MKFLLVGVLVTLAVTAVYASPIQDEVDINDLEEFYGRNEGIRQRRVTCDLLSFGGMVGDSACAANCLSMGKAGGRCNGGICQCRVTSLKDLWDQRFG